MLKSKRFAMMEVPRLVPEQVHMIGAQARRPYDLGLGDAVLVCHGCDIILVRGFDPEHLPVNALPLVVKCYKCNTFYWVPSVRG